MINTVEELCEVDPLVESLIQKLGPGSLITAIGAAKALMNHIEWPDWTEWAAPEYSKFSPYCIDGNCIDPVERKTLESLMQDAARFLKYEGKQHSDELRTSCEKWMELRGVLLDGPVRECVFRFNETDYDGMPGKEWLLVKCLWNNPSRSARFDELAEPVWRDKEKLVTEGSIRGVAGRATGFFEENSIPYRVENDYQFSRCRLEKLPEKIPI